MTRANCVVRSADNVATLFFFFNDTATTEIYTLSLHDALPISLGAGFAAAADQFAINARFFDPAFLGSDWTVQANQIGRAHV